MKNKYFDFGDIALKECDEANIPVNSFLGEPDEDEYWHWTADNFMPRKGYCGGNYEIRAESKEDILQAVRKYVVPLYEIAVKELKEKGELYYWKVDPKD